MTSEVHFFNFAKLYIPTTYVIRFGETPTTHVIRRSRGGVGDKPMSCKPGVAGSIPGFSQSVG